MQKGKQTVREKGKKVGSENKKHRNKVVEEQVLLL